MAPSLAGPIVVTEALEPAMPPKFQAEQVKGFSLYTLRAIISGRGNKVVKLAKANLLQ